MPAHNAPKEPAPTRPRTKTALNRIHLRTNRADQTKTIPKITTTISLTFKTIRLLTLYSPLFYLFLTDSLPDPGRRAWLLLRPSA